jgi:cellulose synthase/poly-beta-1,6-N-acetylglucosamine synthase-like glycosyltransferase
MLFLQSSLLVVQIGLLVPVMYLLLLTAAAWIAKSRYQTSSTPHRQRFGILVPAHNEEKLLPLTLASLKKIAYPKSAFDIHVIADNCSDRTAEVAEAYGVYVHIRRDINRLGKGHALNWCYQQLGRNSLKYDALVYVDADTTVSENFLTVIDQALASGAKAVQAYYAVKDAQLSWNTSLRYAALAVLHYLRPLGRMILGGSAGLKGNGMVIASELLTDNFWSGSITEDIEAHMQLLLTGIPVQFAPQAVVWGEMPLTFEQSQTQLNRWEAGRLEMARKYVPALLRVSGKSLLRLHFRKAYLYFDAALEHLIPPFSVLFTAAVVCLGAAGFFLLLGNWLEPEIRAIAWINLVVALLLVFGQVIYLLSGLVMVRAPAYIYRNLLYAPWFMLRKLGQLARVLVHRRPQSWVKTPRNNG